VLELNPKENKETTMPGKGLYANIRKKRARIKAGSGERMRKPGTKGAPTASAFKKAAKTAKKRR
jgi:cysteine sulfinate desulfinase/cysteine desulfurase-like protein